MGTDINGWVEVRRCPECDWRGVIRVDSIADSDTDLFSCLFGVTPYAQFVPVAPDRGLPTDISEDSSDDYLTWDKPFGESWITWQEIQAIDWDEDALDGRPHQYVTNAAGRLMYHGKAAPQASDVIEEGNSWMEHGILFRVERITRDSTLEDDRYGRLLFRLMDVLAAECGGENVRIVVWFDQ